MKRKSSHQLNASTISLRVDVKDIDRHLDASIRLALPNDNVFALCPGRAALRLRQDGLEGADLIRHFARRLDFDNLQFAVGSSGVDERLPEGLNVSTAFDHG